ncbi:GYF domain-containing protein [Luteolibacter sp. AS25]|uniref:GYF domain-containing protein n=1 Tax=Luteolibacter sp. AS25 TaxID=3135776 RepID=UPI00398ABEF2
MTEWYYSKMGLQQGPVPEDELRDKIRRGDIGESNLIWREGMTDWLPMGDVPEFQSRAKVDATRQEAAAQPVDTVAVPEVVTAQNNSLPLPQPPPHSGGPTDMMVPTYLWQSITALVVSCVLTLFICIPLGVPFAIVALVYSSKVDGLKVQGRMMEASSASRLAKIWMIISFVLTALPVLAVVGLVAFAFFSGL